NPMDFQCAIRHFVNARNITYRGDGSGHWCFVPGRGPVSLTMERFGPSQSREKGEEAVNTTNRRRYESIVQILELCEGQHASIESTPLGAQLMGQLRGKAANVARLFKAQSTGRNS